jgi:hypothetical protein
MKVGIRSRGFVEVTRLGSPGLPASLQPADCRGCNWFALEIICKTKDNVQEGYSYITSFSSFFSLEVFCPHQSLGFKVIVKYDLLLLLIL